MFTMNLIPMSFYRDMAARGLPGIVGACLRRAAALSARAISEASLTQRWHVAKRRVACGASPARCHCERMRLRAVLRRIKFAGRLADASSHNGNVQGSL